MSMRRISSAAFAAIRTSLKVTLSPYPRSTRNPHPIDPHTSRVSQKVDVWGNPAAVKEFPKVVGGFVIPANDNCKYRSDLFACVVPCEGSRSVRGCLRSSIKKAHILSRWEEHSLPKLAQFFVFVWDTHARQIALISDGLKVPADEENGDFVVIACFQ